MLAEMRPSELGMWAALWSVDPWSETRADLRTAIVAETMANVYRGKEQEPFSRLDFTPIPVPGAAERRKESSWESRLKGFLMAKKKG